MKVEDIKIQNYTMVCHIAMDKYHLSEYKGTFIAEGTPLHNKVLHSNSKVYKNKRTGEFTKDSKTVTVYFLENAPETEVFKSLEELVLFYCKDLIQK